MNVRDHLKEMEVDAIKNYCVENTMPAAIAMMHTTGDFNLSNVLRTANFFGFREVFYIEGSKGWDRRGAVGTQNYTPMNFCRTAGEFWAAIQGKYIPIALENNINYKMENLFTYVWPQNPVIIVGEEQAGLSEDTLVRCKDIITIPSNGSVRSMNVGTAAGIAMGLCRNNYNKTSLI
jgi:tRNA G18 (ribose-2'-O)-methylase SpoU